MKLKKLKFNKNRRIQQQQKWNRRWKEMEISKYAKIATNTKDDQTKERRIKCMIATKGKVVFERFNWLVWVIQKAKY